MKIDYTRHYQKWHSDSQAHRAAMIAYYRRQLEGFLPSNKVVKVLDVGCGMGFALLALKDMGFENVAGVESDNGQVESCRAKGLEVSLSENTIAFLKERVAEFGLIICLDVIEHIPVPVQLEFVHAMAGALREDGRLICTVPNANSALAARWRYIDWTHSSSFTEHSLDFLLYNGGFDDIQVLPIEFNQRPKTVWLPVSGARHWWTFKFFRLLRRLEMMAELGPGQGRTVPLSLNLLALARKAGESGRGLPQAKT